MKTYRAAVIGCSRMGGFIDNEIVDSPRHVPPYSHAAGFYACDRTDLVACADFRTDVMEEFGKRYDIPKERQYTDYKEMIAKENLDIVSVATQPEPRAEIVIYAADHGIKAIYAEKAMAASLAEADQMVEAIEHNGAVLNLGTNRRWSVFYDYMKEALDNGAVGTLKSLILYTNGTLFNTASHTFDLVLRLNNDVTPTWVQAHLPNADGAINDGILSIDPLGEGLIGFENGVTAYMLNTARGLEVEAIGDEGTLTAFNDGGEWLLRRRVPVAPGSKRTELQPQPFDAIPPASSTLRLVEDLVHALDTGEAPRGGVRKALTTMELIFGFVESYQRGGARVELPLKDRTLRLQSNTKPRQPKFEA